MESLIKSQIGYKWLLEKSYLNFKKSPKDRLAREPYIQTRLDNLEAQWLVISETHRKISSELTDALLQDKYFQDDLYEKMEELYINYKSDLLELLESFKCSIPSISEIQSTSKNSKNEYNVKLPKITIPTFSGVFSEWCTFKELFISLIHTNHSIDDVQKMHYLKSHLSGEAEQLLRHVPITAASYQESWSLLNRRYNNKRYLANCLLKRFMDQNIITIESCSGLKNLFDITNDTLNDLKNLGIPTDSWDILVIYIISTKLDPQSRKQWEEKVSAFDELPTLQQMREFLEGRFRSLEFLDEKSKSKSYVSNKTKVLHVLSNESKPISHICPFCKVGEHKVFNCKEFAQASYDNRHNFVQNNGLCFNCLGRNHSANICRSPIKCRICKHKHHSLLHPQPTSEPGSSSSTEPELAVGINTMVSNIKESLKDPEPSSSVTAHFSKKMTNNQVLLATALVRTQAGNGNACLLRALLDQGSEASFVTESATQLLGLKKIPNRSIITGLGGDKSTLNSKYLVTFTVQSRHDPSFQVEVYAHVLSSITSLLPAEKIVSLDWPKLTELSLADPNFDTSNKIDILLGADIYSQVLRNGLVKGPNGVPIAQNTALGWILSGPTHLRDGDQPPARLCHHNIMRSLHTQVDDNEMLKRFWQIESDSTGHKMFTDEEQQCEDFYNRTTRRNSAGQYIVRLPFREEDPQCKYGHSRDIATKRFHYLENRFKRNPEVKAKYSEVIQEYIELGHMQRVTGDDKQKSQSVYLPHHAIIREDRTTTKVRVVFDASCKGTNGVSLNDTLMIGPKLQQDLRHIVMRWRMHPVCLSADIVKMYRQVLVAEEDADFQRLVWRDNSQSELEEYRLVRVTFGTASAPYLAVKTLQQVAIDDGEHCPEIAERVKTDFYVDDLLSGCQTVEEGVTIHREMTKLLQKGGFPLQKWTTNNKKLAEIIMDSQSKQEEKKELKMDEVVKVLGIFWDKQSDSIRYSVNLPTHENPVTKRKVISDISRLFDPLGWVAPCVILAKVMIQKLWLAGIDWDEELPDNLLDEWLHYREELLHISCVSIPRWTNARTDDILREIHGFCDTSNVAYAAVVYLRIIDTDGNVHVSLISAKTKVAPTLQVSIPRLELMGAVLLSKLCADVSNVLKVNKSNVHGWTDSTVVLAWLSSHPSRWATFIGNRTSQILSLMDNKQWCHVKSSENPADIASRGCFPADLSQNNLWLLGPSWLKALNIDYKRPKSISTELEQRKVITLLTVSTVNENKIWSKFSSLQRLYRVIAYCRRFLKIKAIKLGIYKFEPYLTSNELECARQTMIKLCQSFELEEDKGKLKPLNPFHDQNGIIRVKGRLQNSNLSDNTKYPIILPHRSHFINLLIDDAHKRTLHGGPLLMLQYLRSKYWIIGAKKLVKNHVRKCVTCVKQAAITKNQIMGQLPSARVTPAKPFLRSGVDFAGLINMRMSKGRGSRCYKGYICVFVCMVTKAIHLEPISDLTADGFIAGFKRFVSRRGHVSEVWSDNGTNFVGASKELQRLVFSEKSSVANEIRQCLSNNSVTWHFIPPHAPNFGGLWEVGVKSTKFHLKRVIGNSTLTFEEMATVLSQIEACLNSRPLSVLKSDEPGWSPLTPGHFLVGEPLINVPDQNYELTNLNSLKRWQLVQRMVQDFWRRWSNEYLVYCLQRYKWSKCAPEPQIGDIVLIKENNLPPARWLLGLVEAKHPGLEGVTRVVTLRCNGGLIKRPTSKLCILPTTE